MSDDSLKDHDGRNIGGPSGRTIGATRPSDAAAGTNGSGATPGDRPTEVLDGWAARCVARGLSAEHCRGPEAFYLATAVETALRRSAQTPHLGRASRSWGAGFSSPGDVVATLSCLREALAALGSEARTEAARVHQVLDAAMLEAVDAASGNLRTAARTDPLTGCANRRALSEDLRRSMSSARHGDLDLAVVAIDLDGLKRINDTHGHAAGDSSLLSLVSTLRRALRESDSLYRVGGDEFVVVAPFTDAAGARELMRRVERLGAPMFSWGVASMETVGAAASGDSSALLQAADADLYQRRRARRRHSLIEGQRRRALAAMSVAATVAATVAGVMDFTGSSGAPLRSASPAATGPGSRGSGSPASAGGDVSAAGASPASVGSPAAGTTSGSVAADNPAGAPGSARAAIADAADAPAPAAAGSASSPLLTRNGAFVRETGTTPPGGAATGKVTLTGTATRHAPSGTAARAPAGTPAPIPGLTPARTPARTTTQPTGTTGGSPAGSFSSHAETTSAVVARSVSTPPTSSGPTGPSGTPRSEWAMLALQRWWALSARPAAPSTPSGARTADHAGAADSAGTARGAAVLETAAVWTASPSLAQVESPPPVSFSAVTSDPAPSAPVNQASNAGAPRHAWPVPSPRTMLTAHRMPAYAGADPHPGDAVRPDHPGTDAGRRAPAGWRRR